MGLSINHTDLLKSVKSSILPSFPKPKTSRTLLHTSLSERSSRFDHKINNMSNNLLMDDSTNESQDFGYSDLPEYVEVYYQFKEESRELKAYSEELKSLERRKMRDAFGFNRGLEKRLKGLTEKSGKLSKSNTSIAILIYRSISLSEKS